MLNTLPISKHEDERRILTEWITDFPLKTAKAIVAKDNCNVGQHYHKDKDEIFFLLKGSGRITLDNETEEFKEGDIAFISRGTKHSFWLSKDSIMLGASNNKYDEKDDHK